MKASQTWFCSGFTLESQSNLVLFQSGAWKPVKLVAQIIPYVYLPELTLDCQFGCAFDFVTHIYLIGLTTLMPLWLGFGILWKLWSVWITFFLLEGLSKAFVECKTLFHSTFLFQINIHLMRCVMQCMIVHEWDVWVFRFVFHSNLVYSSF